MEIWLNEVYDTTAGCEWVKFEDSHDVFNSCHWAAMHQGQFK